MNKIAPSVLAIAALIAGLPEGSNGGIFKRVGGKQVAVRVLREAAARLSELESDDEGQPGSGTGT